MYQRANSEGYALAFFELAKEAAQQTQNYNLMLSLSKAIENDDVLISNLSNASWTKEQKYEYIDRIYCKNWT